MSKNENRRSKKEDQKKLAVRIVCLVLVVALVVTSLLTMFPSLFQQEEGYSDAEIQAMLEAGIIYQAEDGGYYFTEEFISTMNAGEEDGHDHE